MIDFVLGPGLFPGCTLVLGFVEHHGKTQHVWGGQGSPGSLIHWHGGTGVYPDRMIRCSDPVTEVAIRGEIAELAGWEWQVPGMLCDSSILENKFIDYIDST